MATQTLEFGYTTDQTLTAKLFAKGSDVVVQTASSVIESVERLNIYNAVVTDAPAGTYLLNIYLDGIGVSSEIYILTLETKTFYPSTQEAGSEGQFYLGNYVRTIGTSIPIEIIWPVLSASITITRGDGTVFDAIPSFLRTDGAGHTYEIPWIATDYPSSPGTEGYAASDGTYLQTFDVTMRTDSPIPYNPFGQ